MSDPEQTNNDVPEGNEDAMPAGGRLMTKIKVGGFVAAVILVECALAYFFIPSAAEVEASFDAQYATDPEQDMLIEEEQEELAETVESATEVDLGEFSVTAYQPVANTTLRIDFKLFGTVLDEDGKEFANRMKQNEHRFREQVIVTVRSSEVTDLTDAGLGLLKRKILEKSNRILGRPLLQTIIFSEFSFVEQ